MISQQEIIRRAERLLSMKPDPVPRFLIIRDILKLSPETVEYREAKAELLQSKWLRELSEEQWENGSWGRFHTQDTKVKQKIITTEWAVNRGLELGLSKEDDIFQKTVAHMERMLTGQELPLDREEHHYGFRIAFAYIIASILSKIDSSHPLLVPMRKHVAVCVEQAFSSGQYQEEDWKKAYMERNEVMLSLYCIHPFTILQSGSGSILPEDIEIKLLNWIWHRKEGIYYITNHCPADCQPIAEGSFYDWIHGIELLSDFKHWPDFASEAVEYLLTQQGEDGFWDYGPKANHGVFGHLSEAWRTNNSRKIDCSVKILKLLRKYSDRTAGNLSY